MLDFLHQKYAKINHEASDALDKPWDARKELKKLAKPHKESSKVSLAMSKKSFRRNRVQDSLILNERSGDLMTDPSNHQVFLPPEELFKYFQEKNI